jgi:hypothetical protein
MRERVCRLKLLLVLASAVIFASESRGTRDHILLSQIRLSQPVGPGPRIYISQEQSGPVILPGQPDIFRVRVTLRLMVSQSVCLGFEPRLGLMTRY